MAKRYYWLKFYEDFFTSQRMKKLRKLGSDFVIIYQKMLLKSLKTEGVLEYFNIDNDIAEEIAIDIDEDSDKVRLTMAFLQANGLLESNDEFSIFLPYVEQSLGSEDASAQRVREYRKKQKALHCNTDVTEVKRVCNVEIEKEIELEIDIEKEKDIEIDTITPNGVICQSKSTDVDEIVSAWNELSAFGIKPISKLSQSKRKDNLIARIRQYGKESVLAAIKKVSESDFLQGKNDRGWTITFDWFVLPSNFPKVLEGNYDNRCSVVSKKSGGIDWDAL